MAHKPAIQFSLLVVASLVAVQRLASVGAQLRVQSPQVVMLVQPLSQTTQPPTNSSAKPAVSQSITRVELGKPLIKIETPGTLPTPTAANSANMTSPKPPKNRMKIIKSSPELKPKSSSDDSNKGFLSSLVNVDRATNKSKVEVHIPLIFDMTNDKDLSSGKSKLDLTVLSGMVTVNRDRDKGKVGPLTVNVFGMPVYTGTGNGMLRNWVSHIESTLREQSGKFQDVAASRQLPDATMQLYSNIKRTGEKGITSITDSLDRVSSFLKEQAAPIANTNGRAASRVDLFVTKPPQLRPEDLKPRLSEADFKKFATTNTTAHDLHLNNHL